MKNKYDKKYHFWFPNLFDFKGGIQVYLQDFINAIRNEANNIEITIFDKLDQSKNQNNFYDKNIKFKFSGHIVERLKTYHFAINMLFGALIDKPDLILCGHLNFAPVALLINKIIGTPYWILVYGVDAWNIKDKWRKRALHQAQKVISISVYTRDRLIKEENLTADRIPLLPVTFEANRFQIAPKSQKLLSRYGLTAEQPIILTVSRLDSREQYKGYDQIIKALPEIRRQVPNVHYLLVGKGSDRPRIEDLIAQLNLQDCVTLAGFVPDEELNDHYNLCDVFAMPSKGEGFGIVYLEALACGKPTVGGNQDGAIDALCYGELGVLVDPDNVGEIAQTLSRILQGTHPHPLIYQPGVLRQKVIDIYGFDKFKQTVTEIFQTTPIEG